MGCAQRPPEDRCVRHGGQARATEGLRGDCHAQPFGREHATFVKGVSSFSVSGPLTFISIHSLSTAPAEGTAQPRRSPGRVTRPRQRVSQRQVGTRTHEASASKGKTTSMGLQGRSVGLAGSKVQRGERERE